MFAAADLTDDSFLGGKLAILQPRLGYRAAIDPVLMAACVPAKPGDTVLELGCGAGVASLCLGARLGGLMLTGLERQPAYAALARQNAARNAIKFDVVDGDLAALPGALRRPFDHVIANPPFYRPGGGTPARDAGREAALREDTALVTWIDVAIRRLAPGGWLTVINDVPRLADLLTACDSRLGSVTLMPLVPRPGRPATRVILRARKGGRAALRLLSPLILHDGPSHDADRDSYTPEVRAVLRDGADISTRLS